MKRRGKNTKEDVLVEVVRLSGCGKRSRGGVSAKGNLKQADASGTGKHAARHMRIDARRKPSVGPGAGRLSRRADQGKRRGRDNPSVRLGTKGQPEAPGPREKRDYRWQWRRGSPVSIPNTEVKPFSADGTWRVTARKSRSLPVLHHDTLCLKAGSIILKILPIRAHRRRHANALRKNPGTGLFPKSGSRTARQACPREAQLPVAMAKGITCIHPEHRS